MTNTHTARGIVWIDLQSPTEEEISSVVARYSLHPLVGEELRDFTSHSKIDFHDGYMLATLTIPERMKHGAVYRTIDKEIDFVVGKNFLITNHKDSIEQLEYFAKVFETNSILNKDSKIVSTAHLFYFMVIRIYAGICDDLRNIRDGLKNAENHIFNGNEQKMVEALSNLSRELIDFREIARTHREVWDDMLEHGGKSFFGQEFHPYMRSIHDEFNRLHELIQNSRELVSDLRETNDSLLNTKQNNIIRSLTIINFIFIPATFIAALFTIPASYVPLVDSDVGWTIIFAGMALITLVIWAVIKKKGWL